MLWNTVPLDAVETSVFAVAGVPVSLTVGVVPAVAAKAQTTEYAINTIKSSLVGCSYYMIIIQFFDCSGNVCVVCR